MKNLLYKEFRLGISSYAYFLPILTGALMLIPGWLYFIVLMYFSLITVPNLLASFKTQNDLAFSIMMPVSRGDIVKSRILSIVTLELLHVFFAVIYAVINGLIYDNAKFFFLSPNAAFFGLSFAMLALFNVILFPMFYKTGYKYGMPLIVSTLATVIFAAGVELLGIYNSNVYRYLKGVKSEDMLLQLSILGIGILIFFVSLVVAYFMSIKRFEMVDI